MNTPTSRPWWPANPEMAAALAMSLKDGGQGTKLFEFCALAAAGHEWDMFAGAMAALCDVGVRSIRNMIETAKFDSSWNILYGQTAMPPDLLPLFIEILRVARKFQAVDGEQADGEQAGRAQRRAVLQQAMTGPDLRGLKLDPELKAALLA